MYFSKAIQNLFGQTISQENWEKGTISFYCSSDMKINANILSEMQRLFGTVDMLIRPSAKNSSDYGVEGYMEIVIQNVKFPSAPE
jgi:hypothetical protein